jgi:hypothetical protein
VTLDDAILERDRSLAPDEFEENKTDLVLRARLALTDVDFVKLTKSILMAHQLLADGLSRQGAPTPGNDVSRPN